MRQNVRSVVALLLLLAAIIAVLFVLATDIGARGA